MRKSPCCSTTVSTFTVSSRQENMSYDKETDSYTCRNGRKLCADGVRKSRTASGYVNVSTVYRCGDCSGSTCTGE